MSSGGSYINLTIDGRSRVIRVIAIVAAVLTTVVIVLKIIRVISIINKVPNNHPDHSSELQSDFVDLDDVERAAHSYDTPNAPANVGPAVVSRLTRNVSPNKTLVSGMATNSESPRTQARIHWEGQPYPAHATYWFGRDIGTRFICGATLIDANWIVTAAHCLKYGFLHIQDSPSEELVIARAYREKGVEDRAQNSPVAVEVTRHVIHPHYTDVEGSTKNDIALLQLGKIIPIPKELVQAYPNLHRSFFVGDDFSHHQIMDKYPQLTIEPHFSGQICWTPVRDFYSMKNLMDMESPLYRSIDVPVWDDDKCRQELTRELGATVEIGQGQFCAGSEKQVNASVSDGGTGLYCLDSSTDTVLLRGISSRASGLGQKGPDVYTDIAFYKGWIESVIKG